MSLWPCIGPMVLQSKFKCLFLEKPLLRTFVGVDGIKHVIKNTLQTAKKEVYALKDLSYSAASSTPFQKYLHFKRRFTLVRILEVRSSNIDGGNVNSYNDQARSIKIPNIHLLCPLDHTYRHLALEMKAECQRVCTGWLLEQSW